MEMMILAILSPALHCVWQLTGFQEAAITTVSRPLFAPTLLTLVGLCTVLSEAVNYWAIQAGLLTPLTFARHRLSPLAAFTSGAYFLHNGRR